MHHTEPLNKVLELVNQKTKQYPSFNVEISLSVRSPAFWCDGRSPSNCPCNNPCKEKVMILECNLKQSPAFIESKLESKWILTEGPLKNKLKPIGVGVFRIFRGPTIHIFYFKIMECDIEKNLDLIEIMLDDLALLA